MDRLYPHPTLTIRQVASIRALPSPVHIRHLIFCVITPATIPLLFLVIQRWHSFVVDLDAGFPGALDSTQALLDAGGPAVGKLRFVVVFAAATVVAASLAFSVDSGFPSAVRVRSMLHRARLWVATLVRGGRKAMRKKFGLAEIMNQGSTGLRDVRLVHSDLVVNYHCVLPASALCWSSISEVQINHFGKKNKNKL